MMHFIWQQIAQWLSVFDIISIRKVSKLLCVCVPKSWICKTLRRTIVRNLDLLGLDFADKFISTYVSENALMSGSFLLQCILNDDWNLSHVKLYVKYRETSDTAYEFWRIHILNDPNDNDNDLDCSKSRQYVELPKNKTIFTYQFLNFKKLSYDGKYLQICHYDSLVNHSTSLAIFQHALPNPSFHPQIFLQHIEYKIDKYEKRGFEISFNKQTAENMLSQQKYEVKNLDINYGYGKYSECIRELFEDIKLEEQQVYDFHYENEIEEDIYENVKFNQERFCKRLVLKRKTARRTKANCSKKKTISVYREMMMQKRNKTND